MASRTKCGIVPLELNFVVGREGQGTTWTSQHDNQSRNTQLPPRPHPKIGTLDLSHITVLDSPDPYHGLLDQAAPKPHVSFEEVLHLFTQAYSATLGAENSISSKKNVLGLFFNYTNKDDLRVTTRAFARSENIVDSTLFKSA